MEVTNYNDAGIRTHQIAGKAIDIEVRYNLRDLFLDDTFPTTVTSSQRSEINSIIKDAIGTGTPGNVVARRVAKAFKIEPREVVALIKQGIWRRELRVDLFEPITIDKPLRAEIVDVFAHYSAWFSR